MYGLSQATYCSAVAADNWDPQSDMRSSILPLSLSNNLRDGLTGVLISTPTHFFQILEGPFPNLMATISRIRRDERHADFEMLQVTRIEDREFRHWTMASIEVSMDKGQLTLDALQRLHAGDRRFISTLREVALELTPFCPPQLDQPSPDVALE